eukprot:scaffold252139_cov21-Tisochrysis_lutea.AAC.1
MPIGGTPNGPQLYHVFDKSPHHPPHTGTAAQQPCCSAGTHHGPWLRNDVSKVQYIRFHISMKRTSPCCWQVRTMDSSTARLPDSMSALAAVQRSRRLGWPGGGGRRR